MTRRDYELIAATIKAMHDNRDNGETTLTREGVANTFARKLAEGNSRFNTAKFLAACGVKKP